MNHHLRLCIGVVLFGFVGFIAYIIFFNQRASINSANQPLISQKIMFILIAMLAGFGLRKMGRGY